MYPKLAKKFWVSSHNLRWKIDISKSGVLGFVFFYLFFVYDYTTAVWGPASIPSATSIIALVPLSMWFFFTAVPPCVQYYALYIVGTH